MPTSSLAWAMLATACLAPSKVNKMECLNRIDPTIKRDTKYIALVVVILTALMESVFLIIGKWDITVLLGGLLGAGTAILNFFMMGMSVQKAVEKDKKDASGVMKASHSLRMVMLVVICAVAALLPGVFNLIATMVPLLFPSIGAKLHGKIMKSDA